MNFDINSESNPIESIKIDGVKNIERIGNTNKYMITFDSVYNLQKFSEATPWFPAVYCLNTEERKWAEEQIQRLGYQVTMRNYEEKWCQIEMVKDIQRGLE